MTQDDNEDNPLIDRYGVFILPDRKTRILIGRIFGHPNIVNGNIGYTSPVRVIDFVSGWAITRNRLYRLGKRLPAADVDMIQALCFLSVELKCDVQTIEFVSPETYSGSIH